MVRKWTSIFDRGVREGCSGQRLSARLGWGVCAVSVLAGAFAAKGPGAQAQEPTCPIALVELEQSWLGARTRDAADPGARATLLAESDAKLAAFAAALFVDARAGKPLPAAGCVREGVFRRRFADTVNAAFFDGTLALLEREGGAPARAFAAQVRARFGEVFVPGFQVFSEWGPKSTTLPAGFDRSSGGIFVRLTQTPPPLLTVYFVHELAHALDARLADAQRLNARAESVALSLAEATPPRSGTDTDAAAVASAFAWVDMERGYLAEVRAWETTLGVLTALPESVLPTAFARAFFASPFGGLRAWSKTEIHDVLFPRFAVNETGLYANRAARDGLLSARATLEDAASQGWDAVEARGREAFQVLEGALAGTR